MVVVPGVAVSVPPMQVLVALASDAITTPAGRLSVKSRPVAETVLAVLSMVEVRVLVPPDAIGLGVNCLLNPGGGFTVVFSVTFVSLLPVLGSVVADETETVLVITPAVLVLVVTMIVIVGAVPTARLARVQVTTPLEWLQLQPVPDALSKVTPVGSVSVTVMVLASSLGPALLTVIV